MRISSIWNALANSKQEYLSKWDFYIFDFQCICKKNNKKHVSTVQYIYSVYPQSWEYLVSNWDQNEPDTSLHMIVIVGV